MTKAQAAALAAYKRSNKDRKKVLLERMGYKTQEEYFEAIGANKKKKAPKKVVAKVATKKSAKPKVSAPTKASELTSDDSKSTDYVIAFDTTGSMSSYIRSVKDHVVQLVTDLFANTKDLRIKIIAFGDYCDMKSNTEFGDAYQSLELTNDKDAIVNFVRNAKNTSGGDSDEFYELVIRKINNETNWRPDAAKAVLLIGDAACHRVGYEYNRIKNDIDWKQEAVTAKEKGIQYDTLMITSVNWYEELSKITGGVALPFKNAAKISQVIEGTVYARSSKKAYQETYAVAMSSGDTELIGAFKTISSTLD
jgi:hypothetical protein